MGAAPSILTAGVIGMGGINAGNKTENISKTFINSIVNQAISTIIANDNVNLNSSTIDLEGNSCDAILINNCIIDACKIPSTSIGPNPECPLFDQLKPTGKSPDKPCDSKTIEQCNTIKCNISDIKLSQSVINKDSLTQKDYLKTLIATNISNQAEQTVKNSASAGAGIFTPFNIGNTTKNIINNNIINPFII